MNEGERTVLVVMDECWFHGTEPITERTYRVCGECFHAWERDELLKAHNVQGMAFDTPTTTDPETILSCPLCVHDF